MTNWYLTIHYSCTYICLDNLTSQHSYAIIVGDYDDDFDDIYIVDSNHSLNNSKNTCLMYCVHFQFVRNYSLDKLKLSLLRNLVTDKPVIFVGFGKFIEINELVYCNKNFFSRHNWNSLKKKSSMNFVLYNYVPYKDDSLNHINIVADIQCTKLALL